jgi:hypothetical protein
MTTAAASPCGEPDLDRFFEHYGGQTQFEVHLAVTAVASTDELLPMFLALDTLASALQDRAPTTRPTNFSYSFFRYRQRRRKPAKKFRGDRQERLVATSLM